MNRLVIIGALIIALFLILTGFFATQDANAQTFFADAEITTDHRDRGVSLSDTDPSIGVELGYNDGLFEASLSGQSLGTFDSDLLFTGRLGISPGVSYGDLFAFELRAGAEQNWFTGVDGMDFTELYVGAAGQLWIVDAYGHVGYAPDFLGSGEGINYEVGGEVQIWPRYDTRLLGHAGIQQSETALGDWEYYGVGAAVTLYGTDVALTYEGTALSGDGFGPYAEHVEPAVVLTVSRSF